MNILDKIVEQKQREVRELPDRRIAAGDLRDALLERGEKRDFFKALARPRRGQIGLIAEVKKASPSAGLICADFDPARIAKEYEASGADCLSVLTDGPFFQGSLDDLRAVRAAVSLPLLRKDFIIDARQILEAVEWGADAILLIAAILSDSALQAFHAMAVEAGLAVLVEVHDEAELERAQRIRPLPLLLGINNRNLKNFTVDLGATERLSARWNHDCPGFNGIIVAESGIHSNADVSRMQKCGAGAILVGESLMREGNVSLKERISRLLG